MKLNILNMEVDKRISLLVYDKNDKLVRRSYLLRKNKYRQGYEGEYEFDLKKEEKVMFSYGKLNSLKIILTKSLPSLKVRINKRKKKLDVDFYNHGINKTGTIIKKTFKSEVFKYRRGKIDTFIYAQEKEPHQKYQLLIAFDGQNLFSLKGVGKYTNKNDPYGSWQVDQILTHVKNQTGKSYLVVSIDNANKFRDKDLTMSQDFGKVNTLFTYNKLFHNGKLETLSKFIVEDIFDYLKQNYDIDWEDVGTFGSSSGGLASFYLGLNYSNYFSYILSFSPALLLFNKDDLNTLFIGKEKLPSLIFTGGYQSQLEKELTKYCRKYYDLIKKIYPKKKLHLLVDETYDHNEVAWRYHFPKCFDLR